MSNQSIHPFKGRHRFITNSSSPALTPTASNADLEWQNTQRLRLAGKRQARAKPRKGKPAKNVNEKAQRDVHAIHMQHNEDVLQVYCGIDTGTPQVPSNGRKCGLTVTKTDIFDMQAKVTDHLVSEAMRKAISEDKLEEWQEKMRQVANREYPEQDTIMDDGNAPDERGKKCAAHGKLNCIDCRKARKKRTMERNIQAEREKCRSKH